MADTATYSGAMKTIYPDAVRKAAHRLSKSAKSKRARKRRYLEKRAGQANRPS